MVELVATRRVRLVLAGCTPGAARAPVQLAHDAIHAGARGVDMGRNIFQSDCPVGMIRAIRAVVQESAAVDKAFELYRRAKEEALAGRGLPQQ